MKSKMQPTFFNTITASRQWKCWEEEQRIRLHEFNRKYPKMGLKARNIYDMSEVMECGWISPQHFQDFIKFVTEGY